MEVSLQSPDELAERIGGHVALLERAALEAVAAKAYEEDLLSLEQVQALLELLSQWEAIAVLKRHQVWVKAWRRSWTTWPSWPRSSRRCRPTI